MKLKIGSLPFRLSALFVVGFLLCPLQALASGKEARRAYVTGNHLLALQLAQPAAERGDSVAMLILGRLYFEGKGVERDYAAARKWWQASADLGNVKAQSNLGLIFQYGLGVGKDYKEAARWFELSARQGEPSAFYHLSGLYTHGQGYKVDYKKALELLKKAEAAYKEELISDPDNSEAITKGIGRVTRDFALLNDHLDKLTAYKDKSARRP